MLLYVVHTVQYMSVQSTFNIADVELMAVHTDIPPLAFHLSILLFGGSVRE